MGQQIGLPSSPTPVHQPSAQLIAQKELLDKVAAIYKQAYDSAATYAKALIGLGFAGFLTIWTTTRELLGPIQKPLIAVLLSVSLFVYIAHEVLNMMYQGALRVWLAAQLSKGRDLGAVISEYEAKIKKSQSKLTLAWYVSLVLTVIPGFTGGGILIYAFVRRLFH